jgi:hypothetical protein
VEDGGQIVDAIGGSGGRLRNSSNTRLYVLVEIEIRIAKGLPTLRFKASPLIPLFILTHDKDNRPLLTDIQAVMQRVPRSQFACRVI